VSLGRVPAVVARIPVKGQPNRMTLNGAQSLLYVAEDQSDTVDVIDTAQNAVVETIQVIAPLLPSSLTRYGELKGANTNSVALSPDEKQLYVTNGNLNCVSVVALRGDNKSDHVIGLIPTGW
jgi:YVTN family beta-propeller protein